MICNMDGLYIIYLCHSPWNDVSSLTIHGQKYMCNPSELEIGQQLGKGAYGVVHRMVHKPSNTIMAVKVSVDIWGGSYFCVTQVC